MVARWRGSYWLVCRKRCCAFLVVMPAASAEPAREVLEGFGVLGTFAADCTQPVSPANVVDAVDGSKLRTMESLRKDRRSS